MPNEHERDPYQDYYVHTKLTIAELRQFPELGDKSDEELLVIADRIFDLAILAQKTK